MEAKKLTKEEIESFKNVRAVRNMWYPSATEAIYEEYPGIRLSDAQLAKILTKKYGGTEATHIAQIRRTHCNGKDKDYVAKTL